MSRTKLLTDNMTAEERIIAEYIEENASDVLVEKINSGDKGIADCWSYIYRCAENEAKGKKTLCLADAVVFGWAIHYFEEDSIKKGTVPEKAPKAAAPQKVVKAAAPKKEEPKKVEHEKVKEIPGQMTILDFMVGE